MANKSKQKGYRTVASGKKIFFSKGYIGANLEKNTKFAKERDLFGLWDYLFIKGKTHVFVQFKTNLKGQKWKNEFIEFAKKHGSRCVKYEIWNKFDRKHFEVLNCNSLKESIVKFVR